MTRRRCVPVIVVCSSLQGVFHSPRRTYPYPLRYGIAWPGRAGQGRAGHGRAGRRSMARHGEISRDMARHGGSWRRMAVHGGARRGGPWHGAGGRLPVLAARRALRTATLHSCHSQRKANWFYRERGGEGMMRCELRHSVLAGSVGEEDREGRAGLHCMDSPEHAVQRRAVHGSSSTSTSTSSSSSERASG